MKPERLVKGQLTANADLMLGMADSVVGQGFLARVPGQGESMNWVFGHIAVNEDWFLSLLTGSALVLDAEWHGLYGRDDSAPILTAQAASRDEVLDAFNATRQRVMTALRAEDVSRWDEPAPSGLPDLFPTRGDVWGLISTHPFWHIGHLATIRPMLGLQPYTP